MTAVGLVILATGAGAMSMMSIRQGVLGYVAPLCVITLGYALFQVANNTALLKDATPERRGLISGMINLSRNLGLITGASAMGALFMFASNTADINVAEAAAVTAGMHFTYGAAALLALAALGIALGGRALRVRYSAQ